MTAAAPVPPPGPTAPARAGGSVLPAVPPDAPVRSPGDVATAALALLVAATAASHAGYALIGLFLVEATAGLLVVVGDGLGALALTAVAGLVGTRRLPGWRRDTVAAAVAGIGAVAAVVRVEVVGQSWTLGGFVPALAAAALIAAARLFWPVLAGCLALATGSAAAAVLLRSDTGDAASWTGLAVLLATTAVAVVALRQVRVHTDAALGEARRALTEQAVRDPLTGVANRQGLLLVAQPMIDRARRAGDAVHCLMVDVDALRGFNESRGTRVGDELLVAVAEALRAATRTTDVVARWDGDEFVVLGPGTGTSPLEMERRVRAHLAGLGTVDRDSWQGKVSAGVATLVPWDADDLDGLLQRAGQDMALRRSLRRRAAASIDDEQRQDERLPDPTDR